MNRLIELFEWTLTLGIVVVLSAVLLAAFVDIAYVIYQELVKPPVGIIDANGLMDLFSLVLLLLIGLELIETVKTFLQEHMVHVELVVLVAIIAIARKVIVWDFEKTGHQDLFGLAAIALALSVGYFLIKRAGLALPLGRSPSSEA